MFRGGPVEVAGLEELEGVTPSPGGGKGEEARQDTRRGEEGGSNLRNLHHLRSLSHFFTGYIKVR